MKVVKVVLGILVAGTYLYIILKGVTKSERRRLIVVGEMEGVGEGRVLWISALIAFVGTLFVLGE